MTFSVSATFFVLTLGTLFLFIFQIYRVFTVTLRHYFHLLNDGTDSFVFLQLEITRFPLLIVISISLLNKSMTIPYSEGREYVRNFSNNGAVMPNTKTMIHYSCMAFRYCGDKIIFCLFLTTFFHASYAVYCPEL